MNTVVLVLLALLAYSRADDTCSAEVSALSRESGNWEQDGAPYNLYDISAANTGSCEIVSLVGYFDLHNAEATQAWNFNSSIGAIYGFGTLMPGERFDGAGFVVAGYGTPTVSFVTPTCSSTCAPVPCNDGCSDNQACVNFDGAYDCLYRKCDDVLCNEGSTCTDSGGFAICYETPECGAEISMVARANSFYMVDNLPYQVWDMEVKNTGSRDITQLSAYIIPAFGSRLDAQNRWNVELAQEETSTYTINTFGSLRQYGDLYTGAGFIVAGPTATTQPDVRIASLSCSSSDSIAAKEDLAGPDTTDSESLTPTYPGPSTSYPTLDPTDEDSYPDPFYSNPTPDPSYSDPSNPVADSDSNPSFDPSSSYPTPDPAYSDPADSDTYDGPSFTYPTPSAPVNSDPTPKPSYSSDPTNSDEDIAYPRPTQSPYSTPAPSIPDSESSTSGPSNYDPSNPDTDSSDPTFVTPSYPTPPTDDSSQDEYVVPIAIDSPIYTPLTPSTKINDGDRSSRWTAFSVRAEPDSESYSSETMFEVEEASEDYESSENYESEAPANQRPTRTPTNSNSRPTRAPASTPTSRPTSRPTSTTPTSRPAATNPPSSNSAPSPSSANTQSPSPNSDISAGPTSAPTPKPIATVTLNMPSSTSSAPSTTSNNPFTFSFPFLNSYLPTSAPAKLHELSFFGNHPHSANPKEDDEKELPNPIKAKL